MGRFIGFPNLHKRLQAKEILEFIIPHKGERILDFGCGGGFFAYEFARRGAHAVGLDVVPLPNSRETANGRVDFVKVEPDVPIPFQESFFDTVFLSEVLVVLSNPKLVLQDR